MISKVFEPYSRLVDSLAISSARHLPAPNIPFVIKKSDAYNSIPMILNSAKVSEKELDYFNDTTPDGTLAANPVTLFLFPFER